MITTHELNHTKIMMNHFQFIYIINIPMSRSFFLKDLQTGVTRNVRIAIWENFSGKVALRAEC